MLGETLSYRFWRWIVLASVVWWLAGFNLFIYHLASFFLFMGLLYLSNRSSEGVIVPVSSKFMLNIAVFYFLSILLHTFFVGADGARVIAAMYNLSFWIMGFMLVIVMANAYSSIELDPFLKVFTRLAWITGGIAVAMLVLWKTGRRELIIETPLYPLIRVLGDTQLVQSSLLVRPLLMDWFASGARPRFNVFSPYPTAAGAILMIILIMLATRAAIERKSLSLVFLGLFAANFLGLFMTLSRMSILAFVFGFFVVFILQKKNVPMWIFIMFAVTLLLTPLLIRLLEYMLSLREGSNSVRMQLYLYSLQQLKGVDWILGFGVKPRGEAFIFPLGSHSTYISMLFKCGIIGLIILVGFQVSLLWRWYFLKSRACQKRRDFLFWRGLGWVFVALGLWIFTEDIDAPQMLAFLYFSMIGVFEGFRRRLMA